MTDKLITLQSLRDSVANATGPDRDIDADIAEIFGYVPPECEDGPELCGVPATWAGGGNIWAAPKFTFSLDAALAWVEQVMPGWSLLKLCQYHSDDELTDLWGCRLYNPGTPNPEEVGKDRPPVVSKWLWKGVDATTPALAIILAGLDALIAKEKADDQA